MFLKNDPDKQFVNGTIGMVADMGREDGHRNNRGRQRATPPHRSREDGMGDPAV